MKYASLAILSALLLYGIADSGIFANPIWTQAGLRRFLVFAAVFAAWSGVWIIAKPGYWLAATVAAAAGWTIAATGPAPLLAVLAFILAARAIGSRIHAGPALSIALGAAVYMLAIQLLAWFPVNTRPLYFAMLAAPVLIGQAALRRDLAALAAVRLAGRDALRAAPLVFVLLCHWLAALKPEVGADALATHLTIPAWIAHNGAWPFDPGRFLLGVMPMGAHWLFSAVYLPCPDAASGEMAARLLNYGATVLTCLMVRSASGSALAAALFASSPLMQLVAGSLFVEPIQTAFTLAATIAAPHALVPAAILAGAAMMTKLSALPAVAPLALYAVWRWRTERLLPAAALFVLWAAPAYVGAWIRTGNPVFPLANALFNVPGFRTEALLADSRFTAPLTFTTPYDLVFHTSRYYEAWDGVFGLHWLLLPLALFFPAARRHTFAIGAAAALGVLIASPGLRYLLPALALLAPSFGPVLESWRPAALALAVCFGANLFLLPASSSWHRDFALHWLDAKQREAYIVEHAPARALIARLNGEFPGEPALLLETAQLAGLAGPVWSNTWYQHDFNTKLEQADTPAALGRLLEERGIAHAIAPDAASIPQTGLAELIRTRTRELARSGPLRLYEIIPEVQPRLPRPVLAPGRYENDHPGIAFSGSWRRQSGFPQASSGAVTYSNIPGATASFRFQGTGFRWIFTKAPNRGAALLRIDGGAPSRVDLHTSEPVWQASHAVTGLPPGEHTAVIEVTNNFLDVDALQIE